MGVAYDHDLLWGLATTTRYFGGRLRPLCVSGFTIILVCGPALLQSINPVWGPAVLQSINPVWGPAVLQSINLVWGPPLLRERRVAYDHDLLWGLATTMRCFGGRLRR